MEKLFERLGTYDLFSYLLSGMAVITAGYVVGVSLFFRGDAEGDAVLAMLFFAESYAYGMMVHELSSWLDRKVQLGYKPKEMYLDPDPTWFGNFGKPVVSESERKEYKKIAAELLNKSAEAGFTSEDQRDVYERCKRALEIAGKNKEPLEMDAMYSLTRNLLMILFLMSLFSVGILVKTVLTDGCHAVTLEMVVRVAGCLGLTVLFFFRADRFARYRVGEVMSHYHAWKQEKAEEAPQSAQSEI